MLQRAASNAYSWWWASHIRTKQSKWLEQSLIDMEDNVKHVLNIIQKDGDSFARKAEMYYKHRPEVIGFVEETFRAYRSLAERYDKLSKELQKANTTIASIFPDRVSYDEDDDDSPRGPPRNIPPQPIDPSKIPKVPQLPNKDLKGLINNAQKKMKISQQFKYDNKSSAAPKSGLSKEEAEEEIDKIQKEILMMQTMKEFTKSEYESGLLKYWEIDSKINKMQQKICRFQDEFKVGRVIEDNDARTVMAQAALKSCKETLDKLEEKQEQSSQEVMSEHERIVDAKEKIKALKQKFLQDQVDESEKESEIVDQDKEKEIINKIKKKFDDLPDKPLTVTQLADNIDNIANKVIDVESLVASQLSIISRLRTENGDLQTQIENLEDDETSMADGSKTLHKKLKEMEKKLRGVEDLEKNFMKQNSMLKTNFVQARCTVEHLSEKLYDVRSDDEGVPEEKTIPCMDDYWMENSGGLKENDEGDELNTSGSETNDGGVKSENIVQMSDDAVKNTDTLKEKDEWNEPKTSITETNDDNVEKESILQTNEDEVNDVDTFIETEEGNELNTGIAQTNDDGVKSTNDDEVNDTDTFMETEEGHEVDTSITTTNDYVVKNTDTLKEKDKGNELNTSTTKSNDDGVKIENMVQTNNDGVKNMAIKKGKVKIQEKHASSKVTSDNKGGEPKEASTKRARPRILKRQVANENLLDSQLEKQEAKNENLSKDVKEKEKISLKECSTMVRNFTDMKRKLSEQEKEHQEDINELSMQIRELKTCIVKRDTEINMLKQKLKHLLNDIGKHNEENVPEEKPNDEPSKEKEEEEDIKIISIEDSEPISEIEKRLRTDIDAILDENLDFWLRFSTQFHQVQKFKTEVDDLQEEIIKIKAKGNPEGKATTSIFTTDLRSDIKPLYKHLKEILNELQVWLEQGEALKEELHSRCTSLSNIQGDITMALKEGMVEEEIKFSTHQAAKFQGEILNMQQENNRVNEELEAGLDHVSALKLETKKTIQKLEEEFSYAENSNPNPNPGPNLNQNQQNFGPSANRPGIPLRSFIFGVKAKKQKPSIFGNMNPHKKIGMTKGGHT